MPHVTVHFDDTVKKAAPMHTVFPNFDAAPCDPASYDFAMTDEYTRVICLAATVSLAPTTNGGGLPLG